MICLFKIIYWYSFAKELPMSTYVPNNDNASFMIKQENDNSIEFYNDAHEDSICYSMDSEEKHKKESEKMQQ